MAIAFTKSKLILILVVVFTVLVAAGAVGTAILLQSRDVGGSASKAGSCGNTPYDLSACPDGSNPNTGCGGSSSRITINCISGSSSYATTSGTCYDGNPRVFNFDWNGYAKCNNQPTPGPTDPASVCNVGGVNIPKSSLCNQSQANIAGQNAATKAAWCGSCCNNAAIPANAAFCGTSGGCNPSAGVNCPSGLVCVNAACVQPTTPPNQPTNTPIVTNTPVAGLPKCDGSQGSGQCVCSPDGVVGGNICTFSKNKCNSANPWICEYAGSGNLCTEGDLATCNGTSYDNKNRWNSQYNVAAPYIDASFKVTVITDNQKGSNPQPFSGANVSLTGTGAVGHEGNIYANTSCLVPTLKDSAGNPRAIGATDNSGSASNGGTISNLNCFNAPYAPTLNCGEGYVPDTNYGGNAAGGACFISQPACSSGHQDKNVPVNCKCIPQAQPPSTPAPTPTPTPIPPTTPPAYSFLVNAFCDGVQYPVSYSYSSNNGKSGSGTTADRVTGLTGGTYHISCGTLTYNGKAATGLRTSTDYTMPTQNGNQFTCLYTGCTGITTATTTPPPVATTTPPITTTKVTVTTPVPTPTITPTVYVPQSFTYQVKSVCDNNATTGANFSVVGDQGSNYGSNRFGLKTPRTNLAALTNEGVTVQCGVYDDSISGNTLNPDANSVNLTGTITDNSKVFICRYTGCSVPPTTVPPTNTPTPSPTPTVPPTTVPPGTTLPPTNTPTPTPTPTPTVPVTTTVPPTNTPTPTVPPTTPPTPHYKCSNTKVKVTRNNVVVYLNAGSVVKAGEVLTITVTGEGGVSGTGYTITVNGGPSSSNSSSSNPGVFTYTVPSTGVGINIVGYALNPTTGEKLYLDTCNMNLTIDQPTPKIEIDKVAVKQNSTAISASADRCANPLPDGCKSVDVVNTDTVTYKLLVKNTGDATLTNVVVHDDLTVTTGGTAELPSANTGNSPANNLRKCTDNTGNLPANGVCSGYSGASYAIATGTFPISANASGPQVTWQAIPTMAPGEIYEAEIIMKALTGSDYTITNTLKVSTDTPGTVCSYPYNNANVCHDSIVHHVGAPAVPVINKQAFTLGGSTPQSTFTHGQVVEYDVTVANPSGSTITGLTVKDHPTQAFGTFFDTTTFNGTLSTPNSTIDGNGDVVWTGVNIPANSSVVLKFSIKLKDVISGSAPNCNNLPIPNTATITSGVTGSTPSSSTVIYVNATICGETSITIDKTVSPGSVTPGSSMTVNLKVKNYSSISATIKELTDYLPKGFTYVGNPTLTNPDGSAGTITGTTVNSNAVLTLNSGTGVTIAAGQSFTASFQIKTPSDSQCLTYINIASVTNPAGPSTQANMVVCAGGATVLPNTGVVDSIVTSILIGGGMIVMAYASYKYDIVNRLNLLIRSRRRK